MYKQKFALMGLVFGAAILSGCPSNDVPVAHPFCTAFTNQGTVSETCVANCTTPDPGTSGKEVDGDLDTATTATATGGTTSATAKFKVGGGLVASGALPGVFITEPSQATGATRTIRTYKAGTLQQSATGAGLTVHRTKGGTVAVGYVGLMTTKDFDAVEYEVTFTYPSGQTPVYETFEICSDGDIDG